MQITQIYKALKFAEEKHKLQTRKISGDPYIVHPLAVSYVAASFKKSKHSLELIQAAILHDTCEDTQTTFQELEQNFGMLVATLVFELTDDKQEIANSSKLEYQKKKWPAISSYALYLKLADRLCNLQDNPSQESKNQTKEIIQHLEKARKLTKSHKALIQEIKRFL